MCSILIADTVAVRACLIPMHSALLLHNTHYIGALKV